MEHYGVNNQPPALMTPVELTQYQKLYNGNHASTTDTTYYPYNQELQLRDYHKPYEHGFHHHIPLPHPQDIIRSNFVEKHHNGAPIPPYPHLSYQFNPWHEFENGMPFQHQIPARVKQKRPRMSLQKRLLVNARERERMRVLNKAFESLRDALPCYIADGHMAKITTLRLAINYIRALTDLLNDNKNKDQMNPNNDIDNNNNNNNTIPNHYITSFYDEKKTCIEPLLKGMEERLNVKIQQKII